MFVEKHRIEELHEPATVYNFQVEDYHTYFVGDCAVWVHNKNCTPENKQSLKEHLEGTADNTGAKPNGTINGCHEESHFLSELYFVGESAVWVHNSECKVSTSRRDHILEGEGPNDPGHGPNRGFGNSAFPDTWTDDYAIKAVEDVANSPNSTWRQSTGPGGGRNAPVTIGGPDANAPLTTRNGRPVRFIVEGRNHGLDVRVIVEPGGEGIVTGFPINR